MQAFKVKELAGGEVVIEGWANKSVTDRGMDLIKKEAWELDNYKKNPIMLFNHDTAKVVGKAVICEPRDEGLYVKCKLSKSKDPMVQYVRDLVLEGILNTFSVGFNSMDEQRQSDGVNEIKKAELYEVSIVSIPMNQDSVFSVTTKSFQGKTYNEIKKQILVENGAMFASELQEKIAAMESKEGFDKAAYMKALCEKMGCDEETLAKILAGTMEPTEEQVAAAKAFMEEEKPKEEHKPEEKATTSVIAIKIPKASVENIEAASQWAEENGWKGGMIEEEGEYFVAYQEDPEKFESSEEVPLDDSSGVLSVIGFAKESPQPKQKQAGEGGNAITPAETPKFDDNAYLQQARQTNVLLSVLVEKMESMVQVMQSMVKPVELPKPIEVPEDELASSEQAEEILKWAADLDKRIKMLGQ